MWDSSLKTDKWNISLIYLPYVNMLLYSKFFAFVYNFHFLSQWTEYCEKYAKPEDIGAVEEKDSSEDELSEDGYASSDDAIVGQPDP